MLEMLYAVGGVFWGIATLMITMFFSLEKQPIRTLLACLFENRNLFGKLLSFIALLLCLPSIILLMMLNCLLLIGKAIIKLWTLGNINPKKEKRRV